MTQTPHTPDPADAEWNAPPLAIDLDGTLVRSDLLMESFLALIRQNPLYVFAVAFWLVRGRAYVKQEIGRRVQLDVSSLPYHVDLLIDLRDFREHGRRLVLATAADRRIAGQIAGYLQIFHEVMASDGVRNLAGETKRDRLVAAFGEKGFDYAGNSRRDLPVWAAARSAILVHADAATRAAAARATHVAKVLPRPGERWRSVLRALRPHQWLKNSLLFVPMIVAHTLPAWSQVAQACLAFTAFSLCASGLYVTNDLLDLSEDRRHPGKRKRPFAAGTIPLAAGLWIAPMLLLFGFSVCAVLPPSFAAVMAVYTVLTLTYSVYLKRVMMLDVIVLAGLFTLRVIAGSAAVGIWPTHWLLAFSMFIFTSLALVKRYAELVIAQQQHGDNAGARGYKVSDRELLAAMGSACGFISVLVLALYITSGAARAFYGHDRVVWLACPLLFFWISYIWLIAHRGAMHDDPLVFALRDRISWIVLTLMAAIMVIAT